MTIKELKDYLDNFNEDLEIKELLKPIYKNEIIINFVKEGEN